jgi:CBS domain containing-hemolysin-like protein
MSSFETTFRLVAGLGLIALNGFFVAIEFALTRARQYDEDEFKGPGLERAWEMTQELELYLTSCQVGITASSIAVGIVAEPALVAVFAPFFADTVFASAGAGAIVAFLIINLLHLTHGEQTPTYLGVERSKTVCRWGAEPLYWFNWLLMPVIKLGDYVAKGTLGIFGVEMTGAWLETGEDRIESRAELRNRLGSILEEGELNEERREEVVNALDVGDREIREVMVPIEEIVFLSTAVSPRENIRRMSESPHTRYPLIGEDETDFQGIVYFPVFARYLERLDVDELDFSELAAPPMTLSAGTRVSDAIDQFQTESQEMALVVEDGEIVGMVTVTDTLEAVMGDIEDPIEQEQIEALDQ